MKERLPRVLLFVPDPFNYTRGFGITISNLFTEWPIDSLMCLYFHDVIPDFSICKAQFCISKPESRIFSKVARGRNHEAIQSSTNEKPVHTNLDRVSKKHSVRRLFKILGLGETLGLGNFQRFHISEPMRKLLREFNPDVVYCSPTSLMEIAFVFDLYRITQAPIVMHVMDDWIVNTTNVSGLFPRLWALETKRKFTSLIQSAKLRLGIGTELCKEYQNRFNVDFFPFQNCPESSLWIGHGKKEWDSHIPFRFVFTGALYDSCNKISLFEIALAIDYLNGSDKPKYLLDIHTNNNNKMKKKCIEMEKLRGCSVFTVESDQVKIARLYGSADALLLPFDFSDQGKRASRFSMPTKLPAYMFSGSPIFVYGPYSTAAVKLVSDCKCGYVIKSRCSIEILANHIKRFCRDVPLRREFALNARKSGKSFSAEVVRPSFARHLIAVGSK